MNAESFVKYLKDFEFLHQLSYQELKTLSLQYPYCQPLHLLLLKKSYLDNHVEWQENLEKAAAYTFDRTHLYHQMHAIEQELTPQDTFHLAEEYLELRDLAEEEATAPIPAPALSEELKEPLELAIDEGSSEPGVSSPPVSFSEQEEVEEEELVLDTPGSIGNSDALLDESSHFAPPVDRDAFMVDNELIAPLATIAGVLEDMPSLQVIAPADSTLPHPAKLSPKGTSQPATAAQAEFSLLAKLKQRDHRHLESSHSSLTLPAASRQESVKPAPRPKKSFKSWLKQFQEPSVKVQLEEIMEYKKLEEVKKQKKKKNKLYQMPPVAVKSITEKEEVASETLAELLVGQGRNEKAIEMYNRLILLFPEKSGYFAAKINNLKSA
jgi:hypothetical protein